MAPHWIYSGLMGKRVTLRVAHVRLWRERPSGQVFSPCWSATCPHGYVTDREHLADLAVRAGPPEVTGKLDVQVGNDEAGQSINVCALVDDHTDRGWCVRVANQVTDLFVPLQYSVQGCERCHGMCSCDLAYNHDVIVEYVEVMPRTFELYVHQTPMGLPGPAFLARIYT